MEAFIISVIRQILPFVAILAVGGFLIALRFIFDFDKMRTRALDAFEGFRTDLARFIAIASCAADSEGKDLSRNTAEFLAMLERNQIQFTQFDAQIAGLSKEQQSMTLVNRVNKGTGKWLSLALQIEAAHQALKSHAKAYKLEAGPLSAMNDLLQCDRN